MAPRAVLRGGLGAVVAAALLAPGDLAGLQAADRDGLTPGAPEAHVLEVRFVPQERLLCGGAAAEMVLRHAGARRVWARDFAALVRAEEGGIRTDELAGAVRALGWQVRSGPSDEAALIADLRDGRPVTVLLQDVPGRFHYVVVVGWAPAGYLVHDPARGPRVRLGAADFAARWAAAGRWAMTVLPGDRTARDEGAASAADEAHAHPSLVRASGHFRDSRWEEAAAAAEEAARAEPDDPRAWALLGTSRYLAGDAEGALAAWNRTGGPLLDFVEVSGLRRTREPVVHGLLRLRPGAPLEAAEVERARRRLALLPSARATALSWRALPGGLAEVHASAPEAPLVARSAWAAAPLLLRAAVSSELHARLASPMGAGEAWSVLLRWSEARPAAVGALEAPAVLGLPGVARLRGGWERERHGAGFEGAHTSEARTGARLALTDWVSGWLRWEAGIGVDRWEGRGRTTVAAAALDLRPARTPVALLASVEGAAGLDEAAPSHARWTLLGRFAKDPAGRTWTVGARVLAAGTSAEAPRMLQPGAGSGPEREGLLRARRLERGGVLSPETVGTKFLGASFEVERALAELPPARLGVAAFVDAARVSGRSGAELEATAGFLDSGIGLRLRVGDARLRADAAQGLDGRRAVSLAWEAPARGR